jgi:hypothetical protein
MTAAELDRVLASEAAKTDHLTITLERHYAILRQLRDFLDDLARLSILPVRSRARMWARTIGTLLPDENDEGGQ